MRLKRLLVGITVFLLASCSGVSVDTTTGGSGSIGGGREPNWGVQTKTSNCVARQGFPDPACTPGDILRDATANQICQPGYTTTVRNVSTDMKNRVYAEYGILRHSSGEYEIDHFVPLELGGSNDVSNLFPQAALPEPGFHQKDKVENYLHDQVCSGRMKLRDAQISIATNWIAVYQQMAGN